MKHSESTVGAIHIPYNWSYANAAARTGASGFVAGDVGKFARQLDDNSIWMLTATTPTWIQVGGGIESPKVPYPSDASILVTEDQIGYFFVGTGGGVDDPVVFTMPDTPEIGWFCSVASTPDTPIQRVRIEFDNESDGLVLPNSDGVTELETEQGMSRISIMFVGDNTWVVVHGGGVWADDWDTPNTTFNFDNYVEGATAGRVPVFNDYGGMVEGTHHELHEKDGSDENLVEDFGTDGTSGQVPTSDGAGGLTMETPSSGGNISKLFQGVDTEGGLTVTNVAQAIPLNYESIKDDYYVHSTTVNPGEVEIQEDGWYKITAMMTVGCQSASGGIRGNPVLNIQIDTGSGFVAQPDKMGGYVREDTSNELSTSITGVGLFQFSEGDKIRLTVYDTVPTEPDEETLAYTQRLLIEYIDRSGTGGSTVDNLKDVGDVDANAPAGGAKLFFNDNTSEWEDEPLPILRYNELICEDWEPSWADLFAHGSCIFCNTSISLTGLVGNATVATINGLTPTANDSYVVTDSGTITSGSVAVTAGALVVYNGSVWALVTPGVAGYPFRGVRCRLSTTTALISPYTDGTDDGKVLWFEGDSLTGTFTTEDVTITLPDPAGLPYADGLLRRLYIGNFGGDGYHVHVDFDGKSLDGLANATIKNTGGSIMLGCANGSLGSVWVRISTLENHFQLRRAATWAATNFSGAGAAIPWDNQDYDDNPDIVSWAVTPNPSRVEVEYKDHYHFVGMINIDSTGGYTWNVEAWWRKNGTTEIPGTRIRTGNYGNEDQAITLPLSGIDLEVGDYMELMVKHVSLTGNIYSATLVCTNSY